MWLRVDGLRKGSRALASEGPGYRVRMGLWLTMATVLCDSSIAGRTTVSADSFCKWSWTPCPLPAGWAEARPPHAAESPELLPSRVMLLVPGTSLTPWPGGDASASSSIPYRPFSETLPRRLPTARTAVQKRIDYEGDRSFSGPVRVLRTNIVLCFFFFSLKHFVLPSDLWDGLYYFNKIFKTKLREQA